MSAPLVHLHARIVDPDAGGPACPTECGQPCDAVPTLYRDLHGVDDVTCPACLDKVRPVTSRTVEPGQALSLSGTPLGVVVDVQRWESRPDLNGWSAVVTFDTGQTITLTPGTFLPRTRHAA